MPKTFSRPVLSVAFISHCAGVRAHYEDCSKPIRLVDLHQPMHVTLVGGEPMIRHRELSRSLPLVGEPRYFLDGCYRGSIQTPMEWMALLHQPAPDLPLAERCTPLIAHRNLHQLLIPLLIPLGSSLLALSPRRRATSRRPSIWAVVRPLDVNPPPGDIREFVGIWPDGAAHCGARAGHRWRSPL